MFFVVLTFVNDDGWLCSHVCGSVHVRACTWIKICVLVHCDCTYIDASFSRIVILSDLGRPWPGAGAITVQSDCRMLGRLCIGLQEVFCHKVLYFDICYKTSSYSLFLDVVLFCYELGDLRSFPRGTMLTLHPRFEPTSSTGREQKLVMFVGP